LNPVRARIVAHPVGCPWPRYQYNALGKSIEIISPHYLYQDQGLAKTEKTRKKRYTALFDKIIPDYTLEEIRHSINRVWLFGERFKKQIEKQTGRRASPLVREGGRRSET